MGRRRDETRTLRLPSSRASRGRAGDLRRGMQAGIAAFGACRSFCPPILGMFGGPLGGLLFGGETLDYFRLAIGPENIDNPAKSGRIALSHAEGGPMFGHPTTMRLRRPGSSQSSCHNQTDPLPPAIAALECAILGATPSSSVLCAMELADYLRDQAVMYRQLAERSDDPVVKNEMLELASVCEEVANNIEDHLTGG
jgi:hypothetical protein